MTIEQAIKRIQEWLETEKSTMGENYLNYPTAATYNNVLKSLQKIQALKMDDIDQVVDEFEDWYNVGETAGEKGLKDDLDLCNKCQNENWVTLRNKG